MIFNPQNIIKTKGSFTFRSDINAIAHPCLNKNIVKEFWHNFTYQSSTLNIFEINEFIFSIGNVKPLPLDSFDYSINVAPDGICIYARDEKNLLHGLMTLLDRFKAIDVDNNLSVQIECCQIKDRPNIENRMVHFCVFPETELCDIQRFLRFCGALKYTHVVLEFWGMLQYDCMKELSWSNAFTKEQIKPIIQEANDLGLEIIPMLNHWGHASASRVIHGKHVVLDQNPSLQAYFSDDGWCWDIQSPKVKALLREMRNELIELCGNGSYFHIGCDEAFDFDLTENMQTICSYINEISEELKQLNRTTIVWGDMFLYKYPHYNEKNVYCCNAPTPEFEKYMLSNLSKDLLIADWQYNAKESPVETSAVFTRAGFKCMLCPWSEGFDELDACINTAKGNKLFGILHTTWHTLSAYLHYVLLASAKCYMKEFDIERPRAYTYTAALWRKVMPAGGDYAKSGWSKFQVSSVWEL